MNTGTTVWEFIGAIPGAAGVTTVITQDTGTTRDFMRGATIPGARRFIGVLGHGDGEERRGMGTTADILLRIPFTPRRLSG